MRSDLFFRQVHDYLCFFNFLPDASYLDCLYFQLTMNRPEDSKTDFNENNGPGMKSKESQNINDDPLSNLSLSEKQGESSYCFGSK